ncbi:MAG: nitrogen regulation protein NR(II) [Betaproteobacteria bacterium]|nr:nitrogen regulation protein NR(II) [Betaproteobacteria bacterium]
MSASRNPQSFSGLELLATAVLLLERDLAIHYANPAAENLFEVSKKQLLGQPLAVLFSDAGPLMQAIDKALQSRGSFTEQELEIAVQGRQRLHLSCTITPLEQGRAALLVELRHIDRQLRIAREERLLEQQQANRELIRNLAHEIKNPLGGIRGAAQLLEHELSQPQLAEYTQVIISEADRLQALVNRLLTPHRLPNFRLTNIHEILARVRSLILAEYPQGIRIVTDYDISLPELECDPEQILQAVLNVLRNAAQACQGQGEIRLVTRVARQVTLARKRHRLALALAIEDDGPGVPEDLLGRIFYPLVSAREGGTGLGLTIAQTFVAQHQGTIECTSAPGHTVFTIMLPINATPNLNGHTP